MKRFRTILIVGLVVFIVLPCWAGQYTIFASKQFVRGAGEPVTDTMSFTSPVIGSGFTLSVQNGDGQGNNRVSSATIGLNGTPIFGPSDFNRQIGSLQQLVSLASSDALTVNLASAPGSTLTVTITGEDDTPPVVSITNPPNGTATGAGSINVSGSVSDDTPVTVVVNGITATVTGGTFTANGIPLVPGRNTIVATATDLGRNSTRATITVIQEIYPPNVVGMTQANAQAAISAASLTVGNITSAYSNTILAGNVISQNPVPSTLVLPGTAVDLIISKGPATISVPNVVGMTQTNAQAAITNNDLTVGTVTNTYSSAVPAGSVVSQNPAASTVVAQGTSIALVISAGPTPVVVPPDPATVAPPVDATVATTVAASTAFLYSGDNPIQTGVAPGTIEVKRAAVLRGQVSDRDGNPLSGVTVTILGHPEFGQTLTRTDGMFDMAVNGGGLLTVSYAKEGYFPAQRQVNAPWQDYAWLPAVALIQTDALATTINLASASQVQVHQGSVVTDTDGTRQATLLFSSGTTAQMVMPDGSTRAVGSLNIRATEYTVGPNGPKAMPGQLPPASGYTYAVELSADEAITAGAKQVTFSLPVYLYVDNFLGFPVGEKVPMGYYDRGIGQWIPSQNGRVIKILSITGGLADIDTNGDGLADDAAALSALGITQAERQQLAALYPQTPKQLWRVPVTHFSAWDCNWPWGFPKDAIEPNQPLPKSVPTNDPCERGGSIIECQNQVLGERINIPGTSFTLNYRSSRVPGHTAADTLNIPVSGTSVPASLKRIDLIIDVDGRRFSQSLPAAPNQSYTFNWDGKNAYGQLVQGKQTLTVQIGYVYEVVYVQASNGSISFADLSDSGIPFTFSGSRAAGGEATLWQVEQLSIGGGFVYDAHSQGLGGWDLDIHHVYDPVGKVLLLGDGSRRSADLIGTEVITTVAGGGAWSPTLGDGGPATSAYLQSPNDVAVGPDGSIYIADTYNYSVRRVGSDGVITTVAGNGSFWNRTLGDGGPATKAWLDPTGVAVGSDGSIYIADESNSRVRRVGPDGIITTVAGNGNWVYSGDGGPATSASLDPRSVALGPDGSIYISDLNSRIRRVGPDGIITTVAGNGNCVYSGDGSPATSASLCDPFAVAVGIDGSIYIADAGNNRIRRVGPDGIITTVAGGGQMYFGGDGGPAISSSIYNPYGVAVGPDGSIYIADTNNNRIRRVGPDRIITTVAGTRGCGSWYDYDCSRYSGDGGPATGTLLEPPLGVTVGPDGSIYIADTYNSRIRRVASAWPGVSIGNMYMPSEDGSQVYIFNDLGEHIRTLNAFTGATLFSFSYDLGGRLATITDGAGNITTIGRDSSGNPTAIVAPFGQRTALKLDANGYLASVTNPAGESTRMSYDDGGLMTTYTDPKGNIHNFTNDAFGLLIRDENPAGGYTTLAGTSTASTKQEVLSTALGRISTYLTEYFSNGAERQTITLPAGAQNVTLTNTDGSRQITMPDGTASSVALGIDPRFGILVYVPASTTVKTPSGLTRSTSLTRTATLSDPSNSLSLASQTDTLNINSRVFTRTYNVSSMTYTLTTPAGRSALETIDSLGRPVSLLPAASLTPINYSYDAQGFPSAVSQGSLVTTYGYDTLKRLSSVTDATGQSVGFAYDNADRVTTLTLPSGRSYQFTYDTNGNRTSITMPSGAVHKLGYTVIDLGSDYTPPGNLPYAWQYSLDQEWTSTILPSGRAVDAAYDSGGRLAGIVYPEASVSLLYNDKTDRVSSLVRLQGVGGASQQIGYTYDGSLVTGQSFTGTANGRFGYTYDNNFFLKQIRLTIGTNSILMPISRDADGLVTGYGTFTFARSGPAGAISQISDTKMNVAVTYDSLGRVASRTHTVNGRPIYSIQLAYDNRGNISQKTETVPGLPVTTWNYTYDVDGQLVQVTKNGASEEVYGYDMNGNRTSYQRPVDKWSVSSGYDSQDRLTQVGGTLYQFNADGQMTQRDLDTFQYSALGGLLQTNVNGEAISYAYDGMGRQVAKTDSTGTYQYLYGNLKQPFQLTAMVGPTGAVTTYYYDDAGVLFALDENGVRYYVGSDQVGTPKVVCDATGTVVKVLEFDSFGLPTTDSNPDFELPVGFAGGLTDTDTGLVRFGYRDYDPYAGRWTTKDPIFFKGGLNLYGYVDSVGKPIQFSANLYHYTFNNPINLKDPSGLDPYGRDGSGVNNVTRCHVNPHNDRNENLLGLLAALGLTAGPEAYALIARYWPSLMAAAGTQTGQRALERASDFASGALAPGPPGSSPTSAAGSFGRYLTDLIGLTPSDPTPPPAWHNLFR